MRLRLIVPADVDTPTGGNVYDLAVARALRQDGDEVEVVPCELATLAAVLAEPWSGCTLVDGLLACSAPVVAASSRIGVLVHMPLALQTGLSPNHAATLDALERTALRAAAVVVCTSHWSAQYLRRRHRLAKVAVAPPGVEPAPLTAGSDPPMFVHLAALVPHKDQLGVVAALCRMRDLRWQARFAGAVDRDPGYARAVRAAVSAGGLADRVEIPGLMVPDAAWAGADLALLPSRVEAYGMVVTEALARGIPAVVSGGGPAEALGLTPEGVRPGVVVTAADPDLLARVLRRWLTDDAHRNQLRAAARSRRATLEPWSTTADRIRRAMCSPDDSLR